MGQLAFGKECLEAVINKGNDEVAAVYCTPDKENKPLDPIKEYALEQGLPIIQPKILRIKRFWMKCVHSIPTCA